MDELFERARVQPRCQRCLLETLRSIYWILASLVFRSLGEDLKLNMTTVYICGQRQTIPRLLLIPVYRVLKYAEDFYLEQQQ